MNGESTSMVWPTLGSWTPKEQNRREQMMMIAADIVPTSGGEWSSWSCWKVKSTPPTTVASNSMQINRPQTAKNDDGDIVAVHTHSWYDRTLRTGAG